MLNGLTQPGKKHTERNTESGSHRLALEQIQDQAAGDYLSLVIVGDSAIVFTF
jgi:hypothetical protein